MNTSNISTRDPRTWMKPRRLAAAVATAVAVGAVAFPGARDVLAEAVAPLDGSKIEQSAMPGSFADLVDAVSPAVVNISATGKARGERGKAMPQFKMPDGSPLEDFFRRFGDRQGPFAGPDAPSPSRGLGSGFVIDPAGYVVTNYHVVKDADEISVILHDGTELEAQVRGHDEKTDVALIKVNHDEPLPYLRFGESDDARVGDWVIAIGNPFGLGGSTTTGIVSARGRNINAGPYDDFIQIDAPINRGNSGGPLFNAEGEVIGVNTAIFSPNGGNIGIGFAIPSSIVENVVAQLKDAGFVERGWLGVQIQVVTADLADGLGMTEPLGALVASVVPDSPAAGAGLQAGDVVLQFDGRDIAEMHDLPRLVAQTPAGRSVALKLWRDGAEREIQADIGTNDAESRPVADSGDSSHDQEARLGLALAEVNDDARRRYDLDADAQGVLITGVEPGSPASQKGLREGDVIVQVNSEAVTRSDDVVRAVEEARDEQRDALVLLIQRQGQNHFVALRVV